MRREDLSSQKSWKLGATYQSQARELREHRERISHLLHSEAVCPENARGDSGELCEHILWMLARFPSRYRFLARLTGMLPR